MDTNHDGRTPAADTDNITSDFAGILLAHCRHADFEILKACRALTPDQLEHPFEMGPGSVRMTISHNLGAMRVWADAYAGRPRRPWLPDEGPFTIAQLAQLAELLHDDWADIAPKFPLDEVVTRTRGEATYRFTRAHIIAHMTTHSVHHRAQIINMLRHLGVQDLPTGSVMNWVESDVLPPLR